MKTYEVTKSDVKFGGRETVAFGLKTREEACRAVAAAIAAGGAFLLIAESGEDAPCDAERIDMKTAQVQLESAHRHLGQCAPHAPGEPAALELVAEAKARYLAACDAYRRATAGDDRAFPAALTDALVGAGLPNDESTP